MYNIFSFFIFSFRVFPTFFGSTNTFRSFFIFSFTIHTRVSLPYRTTDLVRNIAISYFQPLSLSLSTTNGVFKHDQCIFLAANSIRYLRIRIIVLRLLPRVIKLLIFVSLFNLFAIQKYFFISFRFSRNYHEWIFFPVFIH